MTPKPPEGMCVNCHKRPATVKWAGTMDSLSVARNPQWLQDYCELCALEVQLETAMQAAARVPALRARLDAVYAIDPIVATARKDALRALPESVLSDPAAALAGDAGATPLDREAFELQLTEDAEALLANLAEGDGIHSQALDVALVKAAFRRLLSWAPRRLKGVRRG